MIKTPLTLNLPLSLRIARSLVPVIAFTVIAPAGIPVRADDSADAAKTAAASPATAYRIEPGDVLDISVVDEAQLSKLVTVVPDGTISYPYLGEVKVSGMTMADLRRRIITALKDQLVDPQVTVAISKRRETNVSVLGAVKIPGKRVLLDGWRALDVLADCGGLTVRPEWATATLVRSDGSEQIKLDLVRLLSQADSAANPAVLPGDILLVQEKEASQTQVQVVGEVLHPGPVPIPADGSVITVLNAVGGATPQAALAGVAILRAGQTLPLNLVGYSDTGKVPGDLRLLPGDTLAVPRNKKQVAVLGAVSRPGLIVYPEDGKLDVISALALAGGTGTDADLKGSLIIRKAATGTGVGSINAASGAAATSQEPMTIKVDLSEALKRGDSRQNILLEPGDVLYLPSRHSRPGALSTVLSVVPFLGYLLR